MVNTLAIAHSLINSGIEREQAEAIANVVADAAENQNRELATKDFVHNKISTLETRLVRWIVVTVFSGMGILFAALRLFPG